MQFVQDNDFGLIFYLDPVVHNLTLTMCYFLQAKYSMYSESSVLI
jgi:hypothetical protein